MNYLSRVLSNLPAMVLAEHSSTLHIGEDIFMFVDTCYLGTGSPSHLLTFKYVPVSAERLSDYRPDIFLYVDRHINALGHDDSYQVYKVDAEHDTSDTYGIDKKITIVTRLKTIIQIAPELSEIPNIEYKKINLK